MSRDFEFTISSEYTPAQVYQALTSEEQWMARFAKAEKTEGYQLTSHEDGGLTVDISEEVGVTELPALVKKVIKGTLLITRSDHWGPLQGDHADGTLTGGSSSLPAKVAGTLALRPAGTGAKLTVKGSSTVKIPLIGGKIESLVNDMIKDIIDTETQETIDWVAAQQDPNDAP